jgi:hypothetical protein
VTESGFAGETLEAHPTFWFYVPYQANSIDSGKFTLEDAAGNPVYQSRLALVDTPGFVKISLPTTEKPLDKDEQYRWTFMLYCVSEAESEADELSILLSESNFVFHEGTIRRVEDANLEAQLQSATLDERVNLYLDHEIWYDASANLTEIRDRPQVWRRLLRAMGLEQLAREAR